MLASIPRAPFLSFLKAVSGLPIQAFRKAKEYKDRGWHVISCNFRLLVKSNLNACVVVFFLSNVCWTHANRKLLLQQSCSDELRRYCCKSNFFSEKLFAKEIYITNVRFKSILEPCKCQIAKMFWAIAPNPIGGIQSGSPNPPAPKLRNSQFVSNNPNWKFLAHTQYSMIKTIWGSN